MRRRYDREYEDRESFSPWETYSDLYCGLLLVFVLLFFFAIYQYIAAKEKNNADTAALQTAMEEEQASVLALYKADLENQEAAYQEKNQDLEKQKAAFAIMQADLEDRTALLDEQQTLIDGQKEQLEAQQTRMDEQEQVIGQQQEQLEAQKAKVKEQQTLLDSQAEQIEKIVGVRGELIDRINNELSANQIQLQADPATGAIIFESSILFDTDSNELSGEGKEFFRNFMPVYLDVLLQEEFQDYIAEIIVEGHTDNTGSYLHNLELSQQRAYSVAEYFLEDGSDMLGDGMAERLKSLITVNGCADKAPVYRSDGSVDAERSRRVEIKFRLRDQEMIQEMDEILNNQKKPEE